MFGFIKYKFEYIRPKKGVNFSVCFFFFYFSSIGNPCKYVANVNFLLIFNKKVLNIRKTDIYLYHQNDTKLYLFIYENDKNKKRALFN